MRKRIKIQSDWSKVTLNQFIQLIDLPDTGDDLEDFVNRMSILTGDDPDDIKDTIKVKHLDRYAAKMSFLSKMPKAKRLKWFMWRGRFYKRHDFSKTESSQVGDIMQLNQDEPNEGARILNVLSVVYYRGSDKKNAEYTGDRFQKMKDELGELPFTTAWSASLFFLNGLMKYLENGLQDFSKIQNQMTLSQRRELLDKLKRMIGANEYAKYISGMTSSLD